MNRRVKILVCDSTIASAIAMMSFTNRDDVEWKIHPNEVESEIVNEIADATIYVGGAFTEAMACAATELQFIQVPGAGLDQINFDALPDHVLLANTYNHERSIAEYVIMVMLALSRQLLHADGNLRRGIWSPASEQAKPEPFRTLEGRMLGIVGFGHIGRQVARLARCFDMRICAVDQLHDTQIAREHGLEFLGAVNELPRLFSGSDFVTVALPLTTTTRRMICEQQLGLLKPTAYLINVSRAEIVDEHALYTVLAEHKIAGAALDVWYRYPANEEPTLPANLPFHLLDNVILTPHYSAATEDTRSGRVADVAKNIEHWFDDKPLLNLVPHHRLVHT